MLAEHKKGAVLKWTLQNVKLTKSIEIHSSKARQVDHKLNQIGRHVEALLEAVAGCIQYKNEASPGDLTNNYV